MSTLVVEVCEVKAVYPHPNADALEFITVKGWQVIVQKALGLKAGDRVVYFPPDSVMPPELAERLGIAKYLAPLPREIDGTRKPGLRVRAARLRGEPSYGTIDHAVDPAWEVGRDVKDHYGVTKFEPPVRPTDGDALPPVAAFHGYTEIENIRNFPDVLRPGEEVVITEKLHGKNCRLGLVRVPGEAGDTFEFMAGSNDVRRKEVDAEGPALRLLAADDRGRARPPAAPQRRRAQRRPLRRTLRQRRAGHGLRAGRAGPRGSGPSTSPWTGSTWTTTRRRPCSPGSGSRSVPHLYRGPFSWEAVEEQTYGPTTMCPPEAAGSSGGREGCVVTPVVGAVRPRPGRRRAGDPQVDLGRLPGPQGRHRRALRGRGMVPRDLRREGRWTRSR